jgi:hypothetical protein
MLLEIVLWRDGTYGELENRIKGDVSLNACVEASRHAAEAARERRMVIACSLSCVSTLDGVE